MNMEKIIESWRERIYNSGYNISSFSTLICIDKSLLSKYINNKAFPSVKRFDYIETELIEVEKYNSDIRIKSLNELSELGDKN